jgi:type I restriction enzyme R subunit
MQKPEDQAREKIDASLEQCGWVLQNRSTINLSAALGIALREGLLKSGEADYLLFADQKIIGTVEAKPEGYTLIGVEEQSGKYGKGALENHPKWHDPLPFAYESTGVETQFTNHLGPSPKSRNVFAFHRPETLLEWVQSDTQLNTRLANLPATDQMPTGNLLVRADRSHP